MEGRKPKASLLQKYKPHHSWFVREHDGIHGIMHEARVLVWQEILCTITELDADRDGLRIAAAAHDTQRWDDLDDDPHGERAAAWLDEQGAEHFSFAHEDSVKTAKYLSTWHVPHDHHAPAVTNELAIFKDADALDRVRTDDLDEQYLRFEESRYLVPHAWKLFQESERRKAEYVDLFECVLETALLLELIIP